MNNKIMETLEILEEKIENIKWLITPYFHPKRTAISEAISLIRKTAGTLGRGFPKGTSYENKMRRGWKVNVRKRT